jgi:hypothetical protein
MLPKRESENGEEAIVVRLAPSGEWTDWVVVDVDGDAVADLTLQVFGCRDALPHHEAPPSRLLLRVPGGCVTPAVYDPGWCPHEAFPSPS